MNTVHETTAEYTEKLRQALQRDTALRSLAARATERYAGEKARIDRGLCLALNGHVTLHADGTASVQSGSDAEVVYTVNGHCDCPDVARAPEGRCKHRWAKCLVKRAQAQVREETVTETIDRILVLVDNVLEDIQAAKALLARGTPEPEPEPETPAQYYATYNGPAESWHSGHTPNHAQGTARHIHGATWLFTTLEGDMFYAETADLTLGGRVDIAAAKRAEEEAAGGLAAIVCHHNGTGHN